jgi:GT2 family glycosyltransferase
MRTSLLVLTFNRAEIVERSVSHNLATAGAPIDELVWVDNGSTDDVRVVMNRFDPDVCVLNKTNLGVSKGYNRAYALATGDYIVIVDSDFLLPDRWLATFQQYVTSIPNTGVACILHKYLQPNYVLLNTRWSNGLCYAPCSPRGCRFVSRELLVKKIGFLREEFGPYGLEDLEWRRRAVRVCNEEGLITYAIMGQMAEHLGIDKADAPEYVAFKRRHARDQNKFHILKQFAQDNYRYFNPFA